MGRPWPGQSLEAAERLIHSTEESSSGIKLQMRHMVKDLSKMQERSASARGHIGHMKNVEAITDAVTAVKAEVGPEIVAARQEIFELFARVQSDLDFLDKDVAELQDQHTMMQDVLTKMHTRVGEFEDTIGRVQAR